MFCSYSRFSAFGYALGDRGSLIYVLNLLTQKKCSIFERTLLFVWELDLYFCVIILFGCHLDVNEFFTVHQSRLFGENNFWMIPVEVRVIKDVRKKVRN